MSKENIKENLQGFYGLNKKKKPSTMIFEPRSADNISPVLEEIEDDPEVSL